MKFYLSALFIFLAFSASADNKLQSASPLKSNVVRVEGKVEIDGCILTLNQRNTTYFYNLRKLTGLSSWDSGKSNNFIIGTDANRVDLNSKEFALVLNEFKQCNL